MNIFKILSSGDSKLKEPSISAFLGFLLDPVENHGLGSRILEFIIKPIAFKNKGAYNGLLLNDKIKELTKYFRTWVELEKGVKSEKRSDIDILISMFDEKEDSEIPKYIFSIENKIKKSAINKEGTQLSNQLSRLTKSLEEEYKIKKVDNNFPYIGIIFITPQGCNNAIEELETLEKEIKKNSALTIKVFTSHLLWKNKNQDSEEAPLYDALSDLLKQESSGLIEPIHEYTKYTIKAFIQFIESNFQSDSDEKDPEGKYKKTMINNKEEIEEKLKKLEKYELIKKIHDDILETFEPNGYRYSPKQKRITYSINGSYTNTKSGIFLQMEGKPGHLLLLLRKNEEDDMPADCEDCEHGDKDYLYKYKIKDLDAYEKIGKDLVKKSYNYIKTN